MVCTHISNPADLSSLLRCSRRWCSLTHDIIAQHLLQQPDLTRASLAVKWSIRQGRLTAPRAMQLFDSMEEVCPQLDAQKSDLLGNLLHMLLWDCNPKNEGIVRRLIAMPQADINFKQAN